MREPRIASPSQLDAIPDRPAIFLLRAGDSQPYLARTAMLRRRLKRLLRQQSSEGNPHKEHAHTEEKPAGLLVHDSNKRLTRALNLSGVVDQIEYWPVASQLESTVLLLELARHYYPEDWTRIVRLRPPAFLRLTTENTFARTMISTRLGRGLSFGPFASRAAAETFDAQMLDLFQLRRCEENLQPAPEHPGCIYGEMSRCLRPCQQVVSIEEYRGETHRVEQFLRTRGASLRESAEEARDRASVNMDFEQAERLHARVEKITLVQTSAGELARVLDQLGGVAVVPSAQPESVDLWFMQGGRWLPARTVPLAESTAAAAEDPDSDKPIESKSAQSTQAKSKQAEPVQLTLESTAQSSAAGNPALTAGKSLDHRLREMLADLPAQPTAPPDLDHLSILMRWHSSTWRDGEWIQIDSFAKLPYRKLVNAIARVSKR
jgi:excinuclease UvrABC nuclease subunit